MNDKDPIKIISQNTRGLASKQKRRDVLHFLREKGYHIICLQEIHINNKMTDYVKAEWGYEAIFSPFTSLSRGVAILFNCNFEYKIHTKIQDINGNYLILDISIGVYRMTLANIYGPNTDNPHFYEDINNKWINEIGETNDNDWAQCFKSLSTVTEMKLRDFQFKILHKILPTKSFLHKIGRSKDGNCSLCQQYRETIKHLLFDCEVSQTFWHNFKMMLREEFNIAIEVNAKNIILGCEKPFSLNNFLILIGKYYIYRSKFFSARLNVESVKVQIKQKMLSERYGAIMNNRLASFEQKWASCISLINP